MKERAPELLDLGVPEQPPQVSRYDAAQVRDQRIATTFGESRRPPHGPEIGSKRSPRLGLWSRTTFGPRARDQGVVLRIPRGRLDLDRIV
jgi:hypothetical protein